MSHWESAGKSNDWYTPPHVFEALGCTFDLDVASPPSQTHVPCRARLTSDGLDHEWRGFVWMNPPFGGRNSIAPWLRKFFDHGDGIALTPDRTSAPWFQEAWPRADLVMFTPKLKFLRPDGSEGASPSNGTALWAVGKNGCAALRRAEQVGFGILSAPIIEAQAVTSRASSLKPDASPAPFNAGP
jgi:hypothetical protein